MLTTKHRDIYYDFVTLEVIDLLQLVLGNENEVSTKFGETVLGEIKSLKQNIRFKEVASMYISHLDMVRAETRVETMAKAIAAAYDYMVTTSMDEDTAQTEVCKMFKISKENLLSILEARHR